MIRNALCGALLGVLMGGVSPLMAADTVLTQSSLLAQSGRAYFTAEGKGTVAAGTDGWFVYTPSALADNTTVTLTVEMTNVTYRAYNQFWVEVDNQNAGNVALQFLLTRALPVWDDIKTTAKEFAPGKSTVEAYVGGVGAPGRLRRVQMKVQHKSESFPNSVVTKPIRFRVRLRLTDYNTKSQLWDKLPEVQATALPDGLSAAAKTAGETKRTTLKSETAALKTKAQGSSTSNADKISAYETLFVHKDRDAREIQQAALLVDARAAEAKGSFLYGVISGTDKVSRDDVFTGVMNGSLEVSAARGEAEGVQAVLYPAAARAGVKATVSALKAPDGTVLDRSIVSVHPVGYVKPTYPAYVPSAKFRETIADPILDWTDTADLEAERFQPYWIEANVPEGTKPGTYSGAVTFAGASGPSVAVPLTVTVRQMTLDRHRKLPVVFSSNVFTAKSNLQITYEHDEAVLAELATFLSSEGGDPSVLSAAARAAWDRAEQEHDLLVSHNLPVQNIYSSPSIVQPKWIRDIRLKDCPMLFTIGYDKVNPSVDVVGKHVAALGGASSAIWFYGYDEVSSASAYADMKNSFGSVKAAYPQVHTFCTALDGTFGEKSDCLTEVDAWVDPEDRYSGHGTAAAKARARGKQVWYYPCNWPVIPWSNFHLENTAVASRSLVGLAAWRKKTDGVLYYSVDTFTPYEDTPILSYGFDSFSGGAKKTRLGNNGYDVDVTITTSSSSTSGKAERWESFANDLDKLPPVRIRGEVYVDSFTKSSGYGCNVELRFNYKNKALGDNGQEQNYFNVNVGKLRQRQTIDMTVTPKGEAVNCLFRVYAKSSKCKVIFRNVRVEAADGRLTNRKLGVSEPLPENTVVFDNACYGSFRSNGDGSLMYPGPKGPSSSIRLKCIRDGIDDYEYLCQLDAAVAAVKAGTVQVANKADFLARAATVLAVPGDVCESFTTYADAGSKIVGWRDSAAQLVEEYLEAGGAEEEEEKELAPGIFDSFESFSGASGDTASRFAGDDGKSEPWTTTGAIIVEDGTAFHGKRFLRLADNDSSQHNATKTLLPEHRLPFGEGDVPLSFAFRRQAWSNQTAMAGLTSCNFRFSGRAESIGSTVNTGDANLFATSASVWTEGVVAGRWYLVEGRLVNEPFVNNAGAAQNRLAFRADRVVDTEIGRVLAEGKALAKAYTTVNANPATDWSLSALRFLTWSSGEGWVDIDAIRIGSVAQKCQAGLLSESFETFPRASDTTIAGYRGDDGAGKWSASGKVLVRTAQADAPEGSSYLRINDDTTAQHSVTKSILPAYRPIVTKPGQRRCAFSFSFRRTAVEGATAALTGCKLKLTATSPTTGESIAYTDGADLFATPAAIKDDLSEEGVWYRVTGHVRLETPSAGKRRLALRVTAVDNLDTGNRLYSATGEGVLYSYKDATTETDDFVLSGYTFFTYGGSMGLVDFDDFVIGARPPEGLTIRIR